MCFIVLLNEFSKARNIKDSTVRTYYYAISKYESFHGMSMDKLIDEAIEDEKSSIPLKSRCIKKRLFDFRNYLLESGLSINTVWTYFSSIKTFYRHFEIELPILNDMKFDDVYLISYHDLPGRKDIREACSISSLSFKAVVLFMSSSGCAKAETLSLTVGDFIKATKDYHSDGSIGDVLDELSKRRDIVPTFYLKRIKTGKFYYTFCSPEASHCIVKYLSSRKGLSLDDRLFDFSDDALIYNFQKVNDKLGMGFVGNYRFFRSHALRKFHASNIGLSVDIVDELQGRAKTKVHEAYIKTNPVRLKETYMGAMHNVMIDEEWMDEWKNRKVDLEGNRDYVIKKQEFNIIINFTLNGKEFRI
ncbi:MAG TPA: integrase [Methanosphaera sp.]|nr:integrase [Methanosphaera sp.]